MPEPVSLPPQQEAPTKSTNEKSYIPRAPFPQCFNQPSPFSKSHQRMEEMLEVFKQVKINLPLLDVIKQVPAYAKFLKDLCTQKRKAKSNITQKVFLTNQVSSLQTSEMPPKFKDPGVPVISIVIGDHTLSRALLDLGANVNLLPYSVYEQLGLGELQPTSVTLQLADRSIRRPRGVIEDVLVGVDRFYFPIDFVVLDMEPVANSKSQIPVILGRPFLATTDATHLGTSHLGT